MKFLNYRFLSWFLCLFITFQCERPKNVQLSYLNGYWEIDFIQQEKETFYPKSVTPLYDFYYIKDSTGFLNKAAPNRHGKYEVSKDRIPFKIVYENNIPYLRFDSRWDSWDEKISQLDSTKLILEHNDRKYHYKRPLTITIHEFREE